MLLDGAYIRNKGKKIMSLLDKIAGVDDSVPTASETGSPTFLEGDIDNYDGIDSGNDLVRTLESFGDLIESTDIYIGADDNYKNVVGASLAAQAEELFGESINTEEGVSDVIGSIKNKIKSAKSRLAGIARSAGKRVSRSLRVLKKDSVVRDERLGDVNEDLEYTRSKSKKLYKNNMALKGVKGGLSSADGKFDVRTIIALLKRHISLVEATIKINKDFGDTIKSIKEGLEAGPEEWAEAKYKMSGEEVKLMTSKLKKMGGGVRGAAAKTSSSSKSFPGGEAHHYGPFYGGKVIEVMIDTTNASLEGTGRTSRLLKVKTTSANNRDRSRLSDGTVETLSLDDIDKINKLCIQLVGLSRDAIEEHDKGEDFYNLCADIMAKANFEESVELTSSEYSAGVKRMVSSSLSLTQDVMNLHSGVYGSSLKLAARTIDACTVYMRSSLSNYR